MTQQAQPRDEDISQKINSKGSVSEKVKDQEGKLMVEDETVVQSSTTEVRRVIEFY